jgi:long-chain acyl-CoA synthetase
VRLLERLSKIWEGVEHPFLIYKDRELKFSEISNSNEINLSEIKSGDVVALIGDFDPPSINTFLRLVDLGAIIVPLTLETETDHPYFFKVASVNVVITSGKVHRLSDAIYHQLIDGLRKLNHSGLILFSTGTTGRPKGILHDLTLFLRRFETPRPTLKTINFLLFDHIGGINTLLHTLFNKGTVVAPLARTVNDILITCQKYGVEVLPTTPTFLRMLLISGLIPNKIPVSLKIITYGTERMDQDTLDQLTQLLPGIEFRQTFGMSELGILRVKSKSRNSLFMKIGGEGVEYKVENGVLKIRAENRMLGYLNAESPFDDEGWYDTKDMVVSDGDYIKVVGRIGDVINVGGLKFMASEVELIALKFSGVAQAKAYAKSNPITGEHVEIDVQIKQGINFDQSAFKDYISEYLQPHMRPKRVRFTNVHVGHRFKKI